MNCWLSIIPSIQLKTAPIRVWFKERPVVLFRDAKGDPHALLDRCPHRAVPLSKGFVEKGELVCPYHGWRFGGSGQCQRIPGLSDCSLAKTFHTPSFYCMESQGMIWLAEGPDAPEQAPYQVPGLTISGFGKVIWQEEVEGSIQAIAENLLDATHTHYVHSGLIRTEGKRKEVATTVRSIPRGIEAEYHEGPQSGWIHRLLAGRSKEIVSYGRFLLPNVAQLEYRTPCGKEAFITALLTPTQKGKVQALILITYKWSWWVRPLSFLFAPLFRLALRQDQRILSLQAKNLQDTGDESFVSTPLDLLGPKIAQLLRADREDRELPTWRTQSLTMEI